MDLTRRVVVICADVKFCCVLAVQGPPHKITVTMGATRGDGQLVQNSVTVLELVEDPTPVKDVVCLG